MKLCLAFAVLFLGAVLGAPPAIVSIPLEEVKTVAADEKPNYRLDTDFYPISYDITLKPYLRSEDGDKQFTFDGDSSVTFSTKKEGLKSVTIEVRNLDNIKVDLKETASGETIWIDHIGEVDKETDKWTLTAEAPFKKNVEYTLHFTYVGHMDDDMHGFYRSKYVDDNGDEKWLGSTQFQRNHARRVFPSFDEPKFKAVYNIHIIRHRVFNVASNTRLQSTVKDVERDWYKDTFEPTPKMSTYIIAFLVSEFVARSDGAYLVHARPEFYDQTKYAFEASKPLLNALNEANGIDYFSMGNDKMALAAIPDFSAGAMENWGLLTYRERILLFAEGESTLSSKQSIASIITHEQAHMWWGDLVTCDWWGYAWLNEGFASYHEYITTNDVFPELQMDKQFAIGFTQPVMVQDSTNGTNAMTMEDTNTEADLARMFNKITYNKAPAVIRMIAHAMGAENFLRAQHEYLKKFSFQNTIPQQLFEVWAKHFPENASIDAIEMFKDWTEQVGYPVIYIDHKGDSFKATQERYLLDDTDGSDKDLLYTVPLTYTSSEELDFDNTSPKTYLEKSKTDYTVKLAKKADWVMANIQQTGFYRVFYDDKSNAAIVQSLRSDKNGGIHENNRAQFVDDLLSFADGGRKDYAYVLDILEYLENEDNYLPWTSSLRGLNTIAIRLGVNNEDFAFYIRSLTTNIYNKLGFAEKETDGTFEIYLRNLILSWSCKYGNLNCIQNAQNIYQDLKKNGKPVDANIRNAVYCTALREGSESDFDFALEKFKNEKVATEQTLLVNVMGCVKAQALVEKYFKVILSDVRRQDRSAALTALYTENVENVFPVFKLVTENYLEVAEALGDMNSVANTIAGIAGRFTTVEEKKALEEFNAAHKEEFGGSAGTLDNAVRTVEKNLKWAEARLPSAVKYFEDKKNSA